MYTMYYCIRYIMDTSTTINLWLRESKLLCEPFVWLHSTLAACRFKNHVQFHKLFIHPWRLAFNDNWMCFWWWSKVLYVYGTLSQNILTYYISPTNFSTKHNRRCCIIYVHQMKRFKSAWSSCVIIYVIRYTLDVNINTQCLIIHLT